MRCRNRIELSVEGFRYLRMQGSYSQALGLRDPRTFALVRPQGPSMIPKVNRRNRGQMQNRGRRLQVTDLGSTSTPLEDGDMRNGNAEIGQTAGKGYSSKPAVLAAALTRQVNTDETCRIIHCLATIV